MSYFGAPMMSASNFDNVRQEVQRVAAIVPPVTAPAPTIVAEIGAAKLAGLDRRDQPDSRRRRWAMGYGAMITMFNVPFGTVYLPCYIHPKNDNGEVILFDAWQLDGEHVNALGGSPKGNLALACGECNSVRKRETPVHPNVEDRIAAAGQEFGYVLGGKGIMPFWNARKRRPAGGNFHSARYSD